MLRYQRMVAVGLSILAMLSACSRDPVPHTAPTPRELVLPSIVVTATPLPIEYQSVGTVVSDERVEIGSRLTAFVGDIPVREGDRVKKGQVLVRLENKDQDAAIRQAQAGKDAAHASLQEAQRSLADANEMIRFGGISLAAQRKAQLEYDSAQQAALAAESQFDAARSQLRYSTIVSPVDGIVAARNARVGDLAVPGVSLLVVESDSALMFETSVAESRRNAITLDAPVDVEIDATGKRYSGFVSRRVDSGDPASRSYPVKIRLNDSEELAAGMFGRATFSLGEKPGIAVPSTAVVDRGGTWGVFVVADDNRLSFRWVHTGRKLGQLIEIMNGLRPGERILAEVPLTVRDGDVLKGTGK